MSIEGMGSSLLQSDHISFRKSSHRQSRNMPRKNKLKSKLLEQEIPEWEENTAQMPPTLDYSPKRGTLKIMNRQVARSLTEAKKKEKQVRTSQVYSEHNIFKLPSASLINNKMSKYDIRLPILDRKKIQEEEGNPERRKIVKIPLDRLKPLPVDEVKRRFKLKYQKQKQVQQH